MKRVLRLISQGRLKSVAKNFFDFRKKLTEGIDFGLRDLVYYNEDALNESKNKVENQQQKHFKDGWQNIQITPAPENDSDQTKKELVEIKEDLLFFLKKSLKNDFLELKFEINSEINKEYFLTPIEKYKKLKEINPTIEKFKNDLKLDF